MTLQPMYRYKHTHIHKHTHTHTGRDKSVYTTVFLARFCVYQRAFAVSDAYLYTWNVVFPLSRCGAEREESDQERRDVSCLLAL